MMGLLSNHLSESVFVGLLAVVVLLRFRRAKQYGAATVGILSSAATTTVIVVVALFALVALGYWEPPLSQIVGDVLSAGRAVHDLVGDWLLRQTVERLEAFASN